MKKPNKNVFPLEVTFQPINKCWGVTLKKGNSHKHIVEENLTIALAEMAKYIYTHCDTDKYLL